MPEPIPTYMRVTKHIKCGRRIVAPAGMILTVTRDYNRIGGPLVLQKKSGKFICEYGSERANTHCEPVKN